MNEPQTNKSEKIASTILRVLAIIGLVAVLVLATWTVVQGSKALPNAGENIATAISAVRSVFSRAPSESLVFDFENRTLAVNDSVNVAWEYTGESSKNLYAFSYGCGTGVSFRVMKDDTWTDLACDTPFSVEETNLTVLPLNDSSRFADVTLSVTSGTLEDSTAVTVINTDILTSRDVPSTDDTTEGDTTDTTDEVDTDDVTATTPTKTTPAQTTPTVTTPAPVRTVPVPVRTVVPEFNGPADLVLNIEETGVMVKVSGKNTFFPVSPIPDNKVAGVTFTVTNRGGVTSGPWAFKARLPVEGDSSYNYTSPIQDPLTTGMQVTFTLGFDEVLQDDKGTISIEIFPTDNTDKTSNNKDSVIITIDEK